MVRQPRRLPVQRTCRFDERVRARSRCGAGVAGVLAGPRPVGGAACPGTGVLGTQPRDCGIRERSGSGVRARERGQGRRRRRRPSRVRERSSSAGGRRCGRPCRLPRAGDHPERLPASSMGPPGLPVMGPPGAPCRWVLGLVLDCPRRVSGRGGRRAWGSGRSAWSRCVRCCGRGWSATGCVHGVAVSGAQVDPTSTAAAALHVTLHATLFMGGFDFGTATVAAYVS